MYLFNFPSAKIQVCVPNFSKLPSFSVLEVFPKISVLLFHEKKAIVLGFNNVVVAMFGHSEKCCFHAFSLQFPVALQHCFLYMAVYMVCVTEADGPCCISD